MQVFCKSLNRRNLQSNHSHFVSCSRNRFINVSSNLFTVVCRMHPICPNLKCNFKQLLSLHIVYTTLTGAIWSQWTLETQFISKVAARLLNHRQTASYGAKPFQIWIPNVCWAGMGVNLEQKGGGLQRSGGEKKNLSKPYDLLKLFNMWPKSYSYNWWAKQ